MSKSNYLSGFRSEIDKLRDMFTQSIFIAFMMLTFAAAQTPKPQSEAAAFLAKVAGVYKVQFENSFVDGEKYQSEDIWKLYRLTTTPRT